MKKLLTAISLIAFAPFLFSQQVGDTSWDSPPFLNDITKQAWGTSQGLSPQMMFWETVPEFQDNINAIRNSAAGIENDGKVAYATMQRWQNTYTSSLPGGEYADEPGHQAWVNWIQDGREDLLDRSPNNQYMPWTSNPDESWGHISMWTPMNSSEIDVPISDNSCFADWIGYKIGTLLAYERVRGLKLSDFHDSHPHSGSSDHDFNSRNIIDFVNRTGNYVPNASVPTRAQYIMDNFFNEWNDYINERFAYYLSALVRDIKEHNVTGDDPLLICQSSRAVAMLRFIGLDAREILKQVDSDNIISQWDVQNMLRQAKPPTWSAASAGGGAAREPDMRYGFITDSDNENKFWQYIDDRFPELNSADYDDFGWGWLKRLWMEVGWAHVATREGTTRRAASFFLRNNQDTGGIPSDWINLIRSVKPTRPYGPAIYYSVDLERYWENKYKNMSNNYMRDNKPVYDLRDDGVAFGYYVSDAGLANLSANHAPSAWILVDRYDGGTDLLSSSEKNALQAIAPIIDEDDALSASHPLSFSGNVDGFAFYDQNDRLIVIAGNELDPNTGSVTTTVTLNLSSGTYEAEDLLTGETIDFTSNGTGSFNLYLPRWESRAMAVTMISSADPSTTFEAEEASISNGDIKSDSNASEGQYVDGSGGFNLTWDVTPNSSGSQSVKFRIKVPSSTRSMGVYVNGSKQATVTCSSTSWETQTFSLNLDSGSNTIELRDSEGTAELDVDYISLAGLSLSGTFEAEDANINSGDIKSDSNASSGQYVDGSEGFNLSWAVNSPSSGTFPADFCIKVPSNTRSMGVYVNGSKQATVTCSSTSWETQTFNLDLDSGSNTIELRDSEGTAELDVDCLTF